MRKACAIITLIALFILGLAGNGIAGMDLGISIGDDGLKSFYLAIGDYYRVPEKEIVKVKKKKIPHDEIPVVFFIAKRAGVSVGTVIDLRIKGTAWMDISLRFGLGPDIFYVPVKKVGGPPYGNAYGHYKNKPRKHWKTIRLSDPDVVNLVNLKFISEHYGYPPEEVISMRSKGNSFVVISNEVKKKKGAQKEKSDKERDVSSVTKHKGKGKK